MLMRFRLQPLLASLLVFRLALSAAGCDSEDEGEEPIAGTYVATGFFATLDNGGEIDVIDLGGSLEMTLGEDDAASARLFLPEGTPGLEKECWEILTRASAARTISMGTA